MPIRKRQITRTIADERQFPNDIAVSQTKVSEDICKLVLPRCVENRRFSVHNETAHGSTIFIIWEAVSHRQEPSGYVWKEYKNEICNSVLFGCDRIIGKSQVIGCRGDHVILQIMYDCYKKIGFIYANIVSGYMEVIQDDVHYFPRDIIMQGNVQCMLSPDLSTLVLTLPENCMKPGNNAKVLIADISRNCEGHLNFQMIKDSNYSLKKHKIVAFDPKHPHHMTCLYFHPYCRRCVIESWNVRERSCVQVKSVNTHYVDKPDLQSLGGDHSTDTQLMQCYMGYSRSGQYIIALCLCVLMQNTGALQLRVIVIDSDTLNTAKIVRLKLSKDETPLNLFVFTMDDTDTKVIVWSQIRDKTPKKIGHVDMPLDISLRGLCKKVILDQCLPRDINKLPLPQRLLNLLAFKHM
jgi:hypothetical protein